MVRCKLCQRNPPNPNGLCKECMDETGVVELPPPRRRAGPCLKCNGFKFVRVIPREYTVAYPSAPRPEIAPMTLTQQPFVTERLIREGNIVRAPPLLFGGEGMLETYTCMSCGYVEWYCEDPTEIPIGPEFMSELVDYSPDAPYR